jgi:dTMP kinase
VAYLAGITLLGSEVEDDVRGRAFAFVQSLVQVVLVASLAAVPFLVGVVQKRPLGSITIDGSRVILAGAGALCVLCGIVAYRQMDDRSAVPLLADIVSALRGDTTTRRRLRHGGMFIAFEGGEGVGKTTQITLLAEWLRGRGLEVTETREPGATELGRKVREIVLHSKDYGPSPRSEALLFAADRAHHVDTVIRPALDAGETVITDRFVDSSLAYQGAGRSFPVEEIRRLSAWATGNLRPDLTVLLDADPRIGLLRAGSRAAADRLEQESLDFHDRVREAFRGLAESEPSRYLVIDATLDVDTIAARIQAEVSRLLLERPVSRAADRPAVGSERDVGAH